MLPQPRASGACAFAKASSKSRRSPEGEGGSAEAGARPAKWECFADLFRPRGAPRKRCARRPAFTGIAAPRGSILSRMGNRRKGGIQ